MGHFLEFNQLRGNYSFFAVQQPAWHGLGTIVENAQTSAEAIKLANLDFKVRKEQTYINNPIGNLENPGALAISNSFAIQREDTGKILTTDGHLVTDGYEIFQNWEAFEFFDKIVGEKEAIFHTAGALFGGEVIFISAKLPSHCLIGGIDRVDNYLLLTTRHDGSGAIKIKFTPIRVVCNNTLMQAMNGQCINIKHTKNLQTKLKQTTEVLQVTYHNVEKSKELFEKMAKCIIPDIELQKYLAQTFLSKDDYTISTNANSLIISDQISTRKLNMFRQVVNYSQYGAGQDMETCKNTIFGAYNTVTGFMQNGKKIVSLEDTMWSNEFGSGSQIMGKALELAKTYL